MFLLVSLCVITSSVYFYLKSRKNLPVPVLRILMELKFNLLGPQEVMLDWIYASNKKVDSPQTGKIAVITGGTRGIGLEVIKSLLKLDMEVVIGCRTPSAGEKVVNDIRDSGVKSGKAKVYRLDNCSLNSVKQFAEKLKKDYKKIHVLINNAGVMFAPYMLTEDGFEQQWSINHIAHFLLTSLLLPLLQAGGTPERYSRIVNVTSCAHYIGHCNFEDVNKEDRFVTKLSYAQSKLAQVIFTAKLEKLLRERNMNIHVYSVHPGIVLTDIFQNSIIWKMKWLVRRIFKTPDQGAIPIVYTALSEELENCGGVYINNCRKTPALPDALNPEVQKDLMELSLKHAKLDDFFQFL